MMPAPAKRRLEVFAGDSGMAPLFLWMLGRKDAPCTCDMPAAENAGFGALGLERSLDKSISMAEGPNCGGRRSVWQRSGRLPCDASSAFSSFLDDTKFDGAGSQLFAAPAVPTRIARERADMGGLMGISVPAFMPSSEPRWSRKIRRRGFADREGEIGIAAASSAVSGDTGVAAGSAVTEGAGAGLAWGLAPVLRSEVGAAGATSGASAAEGLAAGAATAAASAAAFRSIEILLSAAVCRASGVAMVGGRTLRLAAGGFAGGVAWT